MTEQFAIQSVVDSLRVVEERLFHFCQEYHVGNYYSAVSVATLQAVENAIVHGNGSNPDKEVNVAFGTCRGGIFVEVADQGAGFDYECYGGLPTEEQASGEGIFVMSQLADSMTYSEGGKRVRLEFIVEGIDPVDALERIAVLTSHFAAVAV